MKRVLAGVILFIVGLGVLTGYFFQQALGPVLSLILDWGILLVGAAGLVGIGYLLYNHIHRLLRRDKGWVFSLILLAAFLFTFGAGLFLSIDHPFFIDLINHVQVPVETSLLAILAVVLLATSFRLISTRGWTPMSIAFLCSAVATMTIDLGLFYFEAGKTQVVILSFLQRLPLAGARGILIGIALGGLMVGLRAILAIDKPYGE